MPTLAFTTLTDLAAQIRSRQISPVAVTRHMLDRIAQHDPTLHAYVTVMREQALAQAAQAEAEIARGQYRGPLHGVADGMHRS
jgi:Asp-tRNA(Asn)/Glu-tRNA(Gln) amidotransferase A subunit family amidase